MITNIKLPVEYIIKLDKTDISLSANKFHI